MRYLRILPILTAWLALGCTPPPPAGTSPGESLGAARGGKPEFTLQTPLLERPWTADPDKFSFIILGDRRGGGEENWPIFDRAVEEMSLLNPDFVIMVGDLIPGSTEDTARLATQWEEFWRHANALRVPFLYLPGNHDVTNPLMLRWWKEKYGRTYYAFLYRGCHFLALNTEELRQGGRGSFGEEQVRWAIAELERVKGARHTFIFMHKPTWQDRPEQHNREEWQQIEATLGDRKYTVFAGHRHNLAVQWRDNRRYFVLSATGAGLRPSEVKELGAFHHYTYVSVDGDSAHVAFVEPGSVWPPDVAGEEFKAAAYRLVRMEAHLPRELRPGEMATGFVTTVRNDLPDTVSATIVLSGTGAHGWQLARGADSTTVTVPPGSREQVELSFLAPREHLPERPVVRITTRYHRKELYSLSRLAPLFPDSALRSVPEWEVVGPFPGGPMVLDAPDPRAAMPWLFDVRGPENGWMSGAMFRAGDEERTWRTARADDDGRLDMGPVIGAPRQALGYALCGVWSPTNRTVYAALDVDDCAQVLVNGAPVEAGRIYRSEGGPAFVPLPLEAQWNTVVVKIVNAGGNWGFALRVADAEGDLRFASRPE